MCIIDSLSRYSINNDLKKILSKIYPNEHPLDNELIVRVLKSQKQKKQLCGYFSLAYATALCFNLDVETLIFDEKQLIPHYIKCIEDKKIEMFPHSIKHVNNTAPIIIKFDRTKL